MNRPHPSAAEAPAPAARTPRLPYETPRVVPLGEWTAMTLANSAPVLMGLPLFGK